MPRFRQINEIQSLMNKKEFIRNLGVIAHIDHGKTTLADSLLAGTGLLSPSMAGSARVLDYLEEEQKRKITIKTANISLLYKAYNQQKYMINLVDTPGHVDFTGKVTRALRAIDGAVVLVDAVEGIMAQTEMVTRQALEERVRPVLFINKVDRLITELHLDAEQIEKKLLQIISNFNDLIEIYGESPFKEQWKINPVKDNVVFGAALHGWGFTLNMARNKGIKFTNIIEAYKDASFDKLQKLLPVQEAIFEMVIKSIPNPKVAQSYRVEKIWSGLMKTEAGLAMAECNDSGPTIMCVTNVQPNLDGRTIATTRVFSGTIKKEDCLHLVAALTDVTVEQVYVQMGSFREEVEQISAGAIAVLSLSGQVRAGETLVNVNDQKGIVPFESIPYVSEPVMTIAVEPKNPRDLLDMLKALHRLVTEDPNLAAIVNNETGEYLLSGMGELHLEIALNQLKSSNSGLHIEASSPRVAYRESVTKKSIVAIAISPNWQNRFTVQVEPIEQKSPIDQTVMVEENGSILAVNEFRNVLVDYSGKIEKFNGEILAAVIAGFEFACKTGPLCREPIRHLRVNILDVQLSEKPELRSSLEITRAVGKAIAGAFLTAKPILEEPVYKTIISVSSELAGECTRIISIRRGKIKGFEQKNALTAITAFIPVAETFNLSKELRSATSGRAFWQSVLDHWEIIPEKIAHKIIKEVRIRKGLPEEIPTPSKFLEEK
jgi:elongation factor 2